MSGRKMVYVCSPLKGDLQTNIALANKHSLYTVQQGYLGIAPHAVCTQYLDDNKPEDRSLGLELGLEFLRYCQEIWVFGNILSQGMRTEIRYAYEKGLPIRHFIFSESGESINYTEVSLIQVNEMLKEI